MTNTVKTFALPKKLEGASSWEKIESEFGIRRTDRPSKSISLHYVELPTGWSVSPSRRSPHQLWLVNDKGLVVAQVFYKEHFDRGSVKVLSASERFAKPADQCTCHDCDCKN